MLPGRPYPLGATFDGRGVNFSVFSEGAEQVELCIFDDNGEETRYELPDCVGYCWFGYMPGMRPGARYGYRAHGPWDPENGYRFNPTMLLLDPYAKAIEGQVKWGPSLFSHKIGDPGGEMNEDDSAPFMPKSIVINPYFEWRHDHRPNISIHETILYEVHVKGFSMRHPGIPDELRGSYAALAHPAAIDYFKRLGVTSIELLPVHQFIHDAHLLERGLRNYWGYNSIGFFAPHNEYAAWGQKSEQVQEFKAMVQSLHEAGLEVILDVVYNHTAEGNHDGPCLSFKGLDNVAYYRLMQDDPEYYMDYTGTGNTLNMRHPHVLQLVMDSLRYWVTEMHVDGFRFDLASALARELHEVDRLSAFFDLIHQDPTVSQVKLIAEPWDVGEGGYQVGNFPTLWSEWNGRYRDCVRDFWRGEGSLLGEFASRITGSADLYENTGRRPHASINFITAHDGFTLEDLVSYNKKHNQANGEQSRDGESHNRSWNCGQEGPTNSVQVKTLRRKQKRNFLTTLFVSQGVPMLLGGDELGRTQQGNNNTYCQDNELSWYDWNNVDESLVDYTAFLAQLRANHPNFRRWNWTRSGGGVSDIHWYRPDATEMTQDDWESGFAKSLSVFLNGMSIPGQTQHGDPLIDDDFLLMFNAHYEEIAFFMPEHLVGRPFTKIIDTAIERFEPLTLTANPIHVEGRSTVVLQFSNER